MILFNIKSYFHYENYGNIHHRSCGDKRYRLSLRSRTPDGRSCLNWRRSDEVARLLRWCRESPLHFQFLKTGQSQIQFVKYRPFDLSDAIYEDVLTFTVEPGESNGLIGGWSDFTGLTSDDEDVFKQAIGSIKGVDYKAFKVSKQIVNGTNYRFICEGNPVVKDSNIFPAIVKVYQPVNGNAVLTGIERVVL